MIAIDVNVGTVERISYELTDYSEDITAVRQKLKSVYDDVENDDILDNVIHHDGREYLYSDDDLSVNVNSDHIATFTDYDHATHGASEIVSAGGEQYVVVAWAKDSSNMNTAKLISTLNQFNKNNNVKPVAF